MKKRGVLYLHWGESSLTPLARSRRALAEMHPELPVEVVRLPNSSTLLDKASMFQRSPFEETLFLDCDTIPMARLDFGFEAAAKHGLACCVCECPWARRYGGLTGRGDMPEYNTGVLFFTRAARPVFDEWERGAVSLDSSIVMEDGKGGLARMPSNDQAAFAVALARWERTPFALPLNWNFRPAWHRSWWGPIKVWHDYSEPPAAVLDFQRDQLRPGAVIAYRQFGA